MTTTWLIRGGRVIDAAAGRDEITDLYIANGVIAPLPTHPPAGVKTIDAQGLVVVPGLIDLHVHFREPGGEEAETIRSGSAAAARGGFTTVVTMPNTQPPVDSPEAVRAAIRLGREAGLTRVCPAGCITRGRAGTEPADLEGMAAAGAVAFTDDGSMVTCEEALRQAMLHSRRLGRIVMEHALDPALSAGGVMHAGDQAARLGLPGIPSAAEFRAVERDLRLCEETGCPVHIQHVSCRETVHLLRAAQAAGLPASGEASPHHLALTADHIHSPAETHYKMSPPLRTEADREAVIEGVADGTLQALATDHAPHTAARKVLGFLDAPFGIVGLETAVGVTYSQLVKSGRMPLTDWVARWTTGPARLLGLPAPTLAPGAPADIAILDLTTPWVVDPEDFLSASHNTPFAGQPLIGRASHTLLAGVMTWPVGH